jgi:hypothetical protein
MNTKTYQYILVVIVSTLTILITACATSLYWQHEAAVHHVAHFESSNWGVSSFHWNDEFAQIVLVDPVRDSLTPPKFSK